MVKKTLISIAVTALALGVLVFAFRMFDSRVQLAEQTLRVGNAVLMVEVADTIASQTRGLSGRESLDQDRGMLFVYPDKKIRNFWMKDMRFLIDVLWIADNKVVGMQENIPLQSDDRGVRRFASNAPADMVLEVSAGWITAHGVHTGDAVDFYD